MLHARQASRHWVRLPQLFVVLAVAGCATWSQPEPAESGDQRAWQARQQVLAALTQWTLQGRIASTGLFGFSGRVRWQQRQDRFVIDVAGPFGAGATRLTGHPGHVEIRNAEGTWVTNDAQGDLQRAYGWTLPLAGLQRWAIGLPIAGEPARITLDAQGQLLTLEQAGWRMTYEQYMPLDAGPTLPHKLLIDNGDTRWRLLVDRWQLAGDPGA